MDISEDLRLSLRRRAQELETSLRGLMHELLNALPPERSRTVRAGLSAKLELFFNGFDDALFADALPEEFDPGVDKIRELSDASIRARVELDRTRRDAINAIARTELDRRDLRNRQMLGEIEAEQG